MPAFVVLGFWGVMQVLGNLGNPAAEGGVAYSAHVGGLIFGVLTGIILRIRLV